MMVPVVMVLERMTMRQIVVSLVMMMMMILMRSKCHDLTCTIGSLTSHVVVAVVSRLKWNAGGKQSVD